VSDSFKDYEQTQGEHFTFKRCLMQGCPKMNQFKKVTKN